MGRPSTGQKVSDAPARAASNVHYFKCDITSKQQIAAVAEEVRSQVGHPTVLINNAGVVRGKSIMDSSERDIRFTFEVNALAHFWMVQEFLPSIIEDNHGMVVTVASLTAWVTGKPHLLSPAWTDTTSLHPFLLPPPPSFPPPPRGLFIDS